MNEDAKQVRTEWYEVPKVDASRTHGLVNSGILEVTFLSNETVRLDLSVEGRDRMNPVSLEFVPTSVYEQTKSILLHGLKLVDAKNH